MTGLRTIFMLNGVLVLFSSFVNGDDIAWEDLFSRGFRNRRVAFRSVLTSISKKVPSDTVIVFPVSPLNVGDGYSTANGKFTVPIPGVYKFSVHVCNGGQSNMRAAIMKGHTQLAVTTVFSTNSKCGSVDTIVKLQKNDVVNVVAKGTDSHIYAGQNYWNSFSGQFLFN